MLVFAFVCAKKPTWLSLTAKEKIKLKKKEQPEGLEGRVLLIRWVRLANPPSVLCGRVARDLLDGPWLRWLSGLLDAGALFNMHGAA